MANLTNFQSDIENKDIEESLKAKISKESACCEEWSISSESGIFTTSKSKDTNGNSKSSEQIAMLRRTKKPKHSNNSKSSDHIATDHTNVRKSTSELVASKLRAPFKKLQALKNWRSLDIVSGGTLKHDQKEKYLQLGDREFSEEMCFLFKCAERGNAKEVTRILTSDLTRLHVRNVRGQTVLHVAASKGKDNVVDAILAFDPDVDVLDRDNNTALHLGVLAQAHAVCAALIKHGAELTVLNAAHMMPVHTAAEIGNVDVMKALIANGADPNSRGEEGKTPLLYAAANDRGAVILVLMEAGAKMCLKCDFGYYAIHVAAKCAAANAMEALIEGALNKGFTREEILSFKDKENNLPLHAAVNGGDMKAVEVCLKAGASVKAQQEDGSTPLHFACAQGNIEMIQMMKTSQEDFFMSAVMTSDCMKMTPLHRAALFNHTHVMEFLIDLYADVDARDIQERTPLLLAASKGCWEAVKLLVAKGAEIFVKDKNNRNFLHLAIKFGGKLEQIESGENCIMKLQNDRDDYGCTPVHYASRGGHLMALDDLIRMGAVLNSKNKKKEAPFHFAAKYGRYNTCRRLLDSVNGPNIINEADGAGLTALHIAAQNGHVKVLKLLLQRGAVVNKDQACNTPLHHAATEGFTKSMKVLLSVHSNLLDVPNAVGDTPLHVAAKHGQATAVNILLSEGATLIKNNDDLAFTDYVIQNKHRDVAVSILSHPRWEEALNLYSSRFGSFFLGLIVHLPGVCIKALDRFRTESVDDPKCPKYHVVYNFKYLDCSTCCENAPPEGVSVCIPMKALNTMVNSNRVDCLSHPVCIEFLKCKWRKYGLWLYITYLFIYTIFLGLLTQFVVENESLKHYDSGWGNTSSTHMSYLHGNHGSGYTYSPLYMGELWFIAIFCALNIVKEIGQMITQKLNYFYDYGNYLEWSLYVTSVLFVVPFLFGRSVHWQWEAGAVAIFLAWFNCLVVLQRFEYFGIYVVMFLVILKTLVQVLIVFSILIIAFGLSFYMLMYKETSRAFSTPALSMLKTFMMMLELDYIGTFNDVFVDDKDTTLHFGYVSLVMLVVFVLLMPILLMNLLIGLAVGDIESVQRDARLKRLAMQVELHTGMERKMPKCMLDKVQLKEYYQFPNKCGGWHENLFSLITNGALESNKAVDASILHNSLLYEEMYRQKTRMRDMGSGIDKNNELLRKIMQKMDIHTEEEMWDEGTGLDSDDSDEGAEPKRGGGRSGKEKKQIQLATVTMWRKGRLP